MYKKVNAPYFLKIIFLFFFYFTNHVVHGDNIINYKNENQPKDISPYLSIYEDKKGDLKLNDILSKEFSLNHQVVPNLGISRSVFWVKLRIKNLSSEKKLMMELSLPTLDKVEFYYPNIKQSYSVIKMGEELHFNKRKYKDPNYLFDIDISSGNSKTYYLKISSSEGIQLPIMLGTPELIYNQIKNRDTLSGMYFGLMLVMIFYNLFLYFSVKDKSYIYYVGYIVLILLTQTSLQGYTFQYLWPNSSIIAKYSLFVLPSLVGIASMVFMNVFLKVKYYNLTLYKVSFVLCMGYVASIIFSFFQLYKASFIAMEVIAMIVSMYMVFTSIVIIKKGYSPAKYFLAAWIVFLLGVIIYILKDFEILPFNNFTRYTMQIGSAVETVLLSFALAARINTYKKEKEESQQKTFEALKENEKIISEQNVVLEQKVEDRTAALNQTLTNLKEAQSQLVDAEKMSSLGQLTAGIAHEINNPINFVSSNIKPLRQDIEDMNTILAKYESLDHTSDIKQQLQEIEDLKEELDLDYLKTELATIINGIEDGATRTTEIVSGLRNFSRLDEDGTKKANINEGIESTIILIRSKLNNIQLIKNLREIPEIECNPGKINQLIMNLLDNAIYAVEKSELDNKQGEIHIETIHKENKVTLTIKDNGIGIPDHIKSKLFDPFFTTKDVGEGTGLGLSIVRNIINSHQAIISVESEVNKGTEIRIEFPENRV